MKSRKIFLILLLVMFAFSVLVRPVQAREETWQDTTPTEYEGTWSTMSSYAREALYTGVYKINLVFTIYSVDTDADDYWVHIDYNSFSPGWPYAESLDVMYRWGMSGDWTHLVYYDHIGDESNWDVVSASASIFQMKFKGCAESVDGMQTTWYFGDAPILHAYWE